MKLKDYIRLGWDQLQRRKVVTALCAVGIAIGSASIMVALSFGESIQHYTQKQMSFYLKTDEITIHEQDERQGGQGKITQQKLDLIRTFPHVKSVASFQDLQQFKFTADDGKLGSFRLVATELDALAAFDSEFQQGGASDHENSIVLTYSSTLGIMDEKARQVRGKLFEQNPDKDMQDTLDQMDRIPYPLYQKLIVLEPESYSETPQNQKETAKKIEVPVRVTGVLKKPDGLPDYMLTNGKIGYVTPELGQKLFELMNDSTGGEAFTSYSEVKVKVDSSANVKQVEAWISKLRLQTQSNLYQEDRMKGEFVIVRLLLTGVGLFVLFVASISIVVAMTMSTHQRRRQIGIMKVLGANLRQIRNMFIVESSLLGMLGGLVGILLTYWVIWGINIIIIRFGGSRPGEEVNILFVSLWILPVGMFFAVLTGVLSGLYPAIKASRTDALTAIKRE